MKTNSKKTSLVILGVIALILSRVLFALFNDPEGPNLLVVVVMAVILYLASLIPQAFHRATEQSGQKKLVLGLLIQIVIVAVLYLVNYLQVL